MHAYREKTFSRGVGCVTEPAWQNRSPNLMFASHMRIGFEIHTESVLYNPWVLLHLRTFTWLARKTHLNLKCNVEPFLRDGKKQQSRFKLQRACTSRQLALLPNCIVLLVWATNHCPHNSPFSRTGAPSRGASSFPCGQERAEIKFSSQRLSGRRICH